MVVTLGPATGCSLSREEVITVLDTYLVIAEQ